MFSTVSAAPGNTSRTKGWWLRNGWTGRPLNLLIGLLAGSSIGLSLLGGFMLLRSRDMATYHPQLHLATEVDRTATQLAHQRFLKEIFAAYLPPASSGENSSVASLDKGSFKYARPQSPRMRVNTLRSSNRHKQRQSRKKSTPKPERPSQEPEPAAWQIIMTTEFIKYLSNQIGDLQVDLRNASSRIAITEDGIRQLREKSWYDWCGAIATLLGQLAGLLAAALALLKWLGSKSTPSSAA